MVTLTYALSRQLLAAKQREEGLAAAVMRERIKQRESEAAGGETRERSSSRRSRRSQVEA